MTPFEEAMYGTIRRWRGWGLKEGLVGAWWRFGIW